MALRIVRLFWWHAKQFVCLPFPLSLSPSLSSFHPSLFYYQKFVTLKKNTHRGRNSTNEIYNNESTVWREHQESKRKRAQRTALPTPKEFRAAVASCCFGSARLLLLLLKFKDGNSGCCCSVLLSTSTRLDALLCRSLARALSTQLNSRQQLLCVCVSRCVRVCVRTSLAVACVRPANAARNFKLGNIHKVKAKVIPLSTTDKSTNLTDNGQSSADTSKGQIKLNSPQAPKGISY